MYIGHTQSHLQGPSECVSIWVLTAPSCSTASLVLRGGCVCIARPASLAVCHLTSQWPVKCLSPSSLISILSLKDFSGGVLSYIYF